MADLGDGGETLVPGQFPTGPAPLTDVEVAFGRTLDPDAAIPAAWIVRQLRERVAEHDRVARDALGMPERDATRDQLIRALRVAHDTLQAFVDTGRYFSGEADNALSVIDHALATTRATDRPSEEGRNPQERAELSPYASMARTDAAAWAVRTAALFRPDESSFVEITGLVDEWTAADPHLAQAVEDGLQAMADQDRRGIDPDEVEG